MPTYFVRDIMSSPALTIHYEADLDEAAATLESQKIRRLPVLDDDGQLVGILTQGDVRVASMATAVDPYDPRSATWLTVGDAMTRDVYTVAPDAPVVEVVEMLLAHKIGGLPVVDGDGAVIGMVTETDIFRLLVREWKET
ncbi:HPP family protein [Candidatus Amarolinea aalborgensis]|uniref:CBS domain-containing protein n=1 Tax=Candidatus Amarolinea aalborgensis TaxID=2249329 RepID=UPI003BF972D3